MVSQFEDPDALWSQCERAWATWLNQMGYTVHLLSGAVGNATTTLAPMAQTPSAAARQPDIVAMKPGLTEYWEVKYRSAPEVDPVTGVRQHWMSRQAFQDYRRLAHSDQLPFHLILFEGPTATHLKGRWLRASLRELRDAGHREKRPARNGQSIEAWVWPVSAMTEVEGPDLAPTAAATLSPILPNEGVGEWLDDAALEEAERRRRWPEGQTAAAEGPGRIPRGDVARRLIDESHATALAAVSRRLGLPLVPQYSVTRVGPLQDADDVLALIEYGIRVFLVTKDTLSSHLPPAQLAAFQGARLLEYAQVPETHGAVHWAVDGTVVAGDPSAFDAAMSRAEAAEGFNYGQWRVVHAPHAENILVRAGAGTGKTETMTERMVFLLATHQTAAKGTASSGELTPGHFAFVTFTKEAALQMRTRLARTLMLRQRLCQYCVPPVVAWMLQLNNASISTIHTFAKRTIQLTGASVGYAPNFRVSSLTMPFRRLLQTRLSPDLADLTRRLGPGAARNAPPAYAWEDHLEAVWTGLENNGLPLMRLEGGPAPQIAWGTTQGNQLSKDVLAITERTLRGVAEDFRGLCREEQVIPTSQLIPLAVAGASKSSDRLPDLRYIFVDEFQDTDAMQIELFLQIHRHTGANMFVVGDVKQGIYRFRGAAGNAFAQLDERVHQLGLAGFQPYGLTKNFRSGKSLLDSLHPVFLSWGKRGWLEYKPDEKLRAGSAQRPDISLPVSYVDRRSWSDQASAAEAAATILRWRADRASDSLAILCRENWQARMVQEAIRERGGHCVVYVGGEFFRTPAVTEARTFLEALLAPSDASALLQLAETRWGAGVVGSQPPDVLVEEDAQGWRAAGDTPVDWRSRFGSLVASGNLRTDDLRGLSSRLGILRRLLNRSSVVGLLVDCTAWFAPDAVERPCERDEDRRQYSHCLNHLITLISDTFDDGSASPLQVLEWLRLQIATNTDEDEPYEEGALTAAGATVALSVHKAKGLEYDRVVLPFTTKPFVRTRPRKGTEVAVLRRGNATPALLWRWAPPRGQVFANYRPDDPDDKDNLHEAMLEEARLLYVALTRARTQAIAFRTPVARVPDTPNSWSDLLSSPRSN